jgi:pyruvate/2-oxoglutarate dehydrogenase complex dihydrolipoamide acyltransferase (E2) component
MKKILILVAVVSLRPESRSIAFHNRGRFERPDRGLRQHRADRSQHRLQDRRAAHRAHVDEGDLVKKGQVIARLDRDQLVAQRDAWPPAWNRRRIATGAGGRPRSTGSGTRWRRHRTAARRPGLQRSAPGGDEERLAPAGKSRTPRRPWMRRNRSSSAPRKIGTARRRCFKTTTSPPRSSTNPQSLGERRRGAEFRPKSARPGVGRAARGEVMDGAAGAGGPSRGALKMAEANSLE